MSDASLTTIVDLAHVRPPPRVEDPHRSPCDILSIPCDQGEIMHERRRREESVAAGSLSGTFSGPHTSRSPSLRAGCLPLMVFGPLSLLVPGPTIEVEGVRIPVPRPAGLAREKLVTDRTGDKGDRDLFVVAGLLGVMGAGERDELALAYLRLPVELQHQVRSNVAILSLSQPVPSMPDPLGCRGMVDSLLRRLGGP